MIRLEGLSVTFGRTLALDDLSLELHPGVTGLFGPNGAGKSTLLRAITGLVRPTRGRVLFGDEPVRLEDEAFRARVSYAGHDSGLYGDLSVGENLALFAALYGAPEANVRRCLEAVGLTDRSATRVRDLSAGLKRRAAVAKALVHDPTILLLDEPYANLDDDAAQAVSNAILEWARPGRYAVIATHGAKRVKPFATASVILQHGHVVSHTVRVPERG